MMRRALLAFLLAGCNALLGIEAGSYGAPPASGEDAGDGAGRADSDGGAREGAADAAAEACAVDCRPGACQPDGGCSAGVVTVDPSEPTVLHVVGDAIFYQTSRGAVRRVPITGGEPETLFADTTMPGERGSGPNLVSIDDHLYFSDVRGRRVARCPLAGPCTAETVLDAMAIPAWLAAASGTLYASEQGSRIVRCRPMPCTRELFVEGEIGVTLVTATQEDVVWATATSAGAEVGIRHRAAEGGEPRTVFKSPALGASGATSLVLAGRAFYTVFDGGLRYHRLDSVGFPSFRGSIGPTLTLSLVGDELWYGDRASGGIFRRQTAAPDGEPSTLVVDGDASAFGVVKRPNDLVWISKDGRVWRWVR